MTDTLAFIAFAGLAAQLVLLIFVILVEPAD
jgi:hypothetical protein